MKSYLARTLDNTLRLGVLLIALGIPMLALTASAASGPLAPLVNASPWLIGIGLLILLVAGVFKLAKMGKWALPAGVVGGLLFVVGIGGYAIGYLTSAGPPTDCEAPNVLVNGACLPPAPTGYVADWNCQVYETTVGSAPGTAHDAVTEFPDAPFIAADGGTPDLNKVLAVDIIDPQNKKVAYDIAIDDDLIQTAAGYVATDATVQDINCKLKNPVPAVGGGLQEIPLWGRLTPSRTSGTAANGTYAPVFYCDATAGYYLGLGAIADSGAVPASHTADHTYVSYTEQNSCPAPAPLVGDWQPLGTSDGDPDGEWVGFWFVLDIGISDYTSPAIGTSVDVLIELGTDPTSTVYDGNLSTLTASIRISART